MKICRSIDEPIRKEASCEHRWTAADAGLIACWERGREKAQEDPVIASKAAIGQLVQLPWKGGVDKETKKKQKFGTLFYLAMWQGLRGESLDIDPDSEVALTCTATGITVVYTGDKGKYAEA
jgi:hypothetical protein